MKKVNILILLTLFIFSCQNSNIAPTESKIFIDFQGEKLMLNNGISEEDVSTFLNYNVENEIKKLKVNGEVDIDWNKVPSNVFNKILNESILKFPDLTKEKYSDDEFKFIKNSFPDLTSKEEASLNKKHIIIDYLDILIGKEIKKEVKIYINSLKKGKPDNYFTTAQAGYNSLNPTEQDVASTYPTHVAYVANAKTQTFNSFPSHNDNTIINSRFHAFWTAGVVKEICHLTLNKWKGLNRAKQFVTAHEYDTKDVEFGVSVPGHVAVFNVRNFGLPNYMDLHNNLVGRNYMYNTVGQTILGNANNIPTYAQILTFVNGCSNIQTPTIQSILNINSNYTMDFIGHYKNAVDYHTPVGYTLAYVQ